MHDHVLTFKADIDILGTNNTLQRHTVAKTEASYTWSNTTRSTMHVERSNITNEDQGMISWASNGASMYNVVNYDAKNKFGEARGYRMLPGRGGGMYMTIQDSSNLLKSQSFATHGFYVTKQHDDEASASHPNNAMDPANPVVSILLGEGCSANR